MTALPIGFVSPAWAQLSDAEAALLDAEIAPQVDGPKACDEAIMLLSEGIESGALARGDLWEAGVMRGDRCQYKELPESAIADYRKALRVNPGDDYTVKALRRLGVSP